MSKDESAKRPSLAAAELMSISDTHLQENWKMMESLMAAMKEEGKKNRIVKALNSECNGAWCFNEIGVDSTQSVLKQVLCLFLEGRGCYIDTYTTSDLSSSADGPKKEESKKAFRDKLKEEIMIMTGTIPTIKFDDGYWTIYHG